MVSRTCEQRPADNVEAGSLHYRSGQQVSLIGADNPGRADNLVSTTCCSTLIPFPAYWRLCLLTTTIYVPDHHTPGQNITDLADIPAPGFPLLPLPVSADFFTAAEVLLGVFPLLAGLIIPVHRLMGLS